MHAGLWQQSNPFTDRLLNSTVSWTAAGDSSASAPKILCKLEGHTTTEAAAGGVLVQASSRWAHRGSSAEQSHKLQFSFLQFRENWSLLPLYCYKNVQSMSNSCIYKSMGMPPCHSVQSFLTPSPRSCLIFPFHTSQTGSRSPKGWFWIWGRILPVIYLSSLIIIKYLMAHSTVFLQKKY